jgi:ABC-type tungstate transport system permease subunit
MKNTLFLECNKYSDERKQLMNSYQYIGVNPVKFNHIMNPTSIAEAYSLINYIRNENVWKIKLINIALSTLTGIITNTLHYCYLYEKQTE